MKAGWLSAAVLGTALWLGGQTAQAAAPVSDDFAGTTLKSMWKSADVGQSDGGSVTVNGGKLLPVGTGNDLWGASFQFYYVYQTNITGSFDVTLKVDATPIPDHGDGWSSVGLLVTTPDALNYDVNAADAASTIPPHVGISLTNNNGIQMKWGAAGQSGDSELAGGLKPPAWVKLVKLGDTFVSYYSTDGVTFKRAGVTTNPYPQFPMKDPLLLGVCVQAHDGTNAGAPEVSNFQALELGANSAAPAPAAISDLAAAAKDAASVTLSWSAPTTTANSYFDVRRSLLPITEANFAQATRVANDELGVSGQKVSLDVTGLDPVQKYYFAVKATDQNLKTTPLSNLADATTYPQNANNGLLHEVYNNIGGTVITDLTNNARYTANTPDLSDYVPSFESPTTGDNYGQRLRGYIVPAETGDYTFSIASDDAGELWLSTDDKPANAELIASVAGWTNAHDWANANEANQTSGLISLVKGKRYYVYALHKEGTGGDNLSVAWTPPSGVLEGPIPGKYLIPISLGGPQGRLSGLVTDGDGKGLNMAVVTVTGADGKPLTATTDATGWFSLMAPEGNDQVTVAFPVPWQTTTLTDTVAVRADQVSQKDFAFTVVKPPFMPQNPDSAISDSFDGSSLASKWTSVDIGTVDPAGDAKVGGGALTVSASGSDIWGGGDNFHYVYQKVSGDFEAALQVFTVPQTDGWSKSGLMLRESEDPLSLHWLVAATRDNGVTAQGRTVADPETNAELARLSFTANTGTWVKLVRQGQKIWAFRSLDGVNYDSNGEELHPGLADKDLLLGIATTAHLAGTLGDSKVDNFVFSTTVQKDLLPGTVTPPPPPVTLGDVNGDQKVTIVDVITALRAAAGLSQLTDAQKAAADVTGDGKFNITDVITMLRFTAGLITTFPGQK